MRVQVYPVRNRGVCNKPSQKRNRVTLYIYIYSSCSIINERTNERTRYKRVVESGPPREICLGTIGGTVFVRFTRQTIKAFSKTRNSRTRNSGTRNSGTWKTKQQRQNNKHKKIKSVFIN